MLGRRDGTARFGTFRGYTNHPELALAVIDSSSVQRAAVDPVADGVVAALITGVTGPD